MMDPLSDVLRSFRLTGGVFLDAHFTAPWCVVSRLSPDDLGPFLATPSLLIAYHFVIAGRFLLTIEGDRTIEDAPAKLCCCPATTFTYWPAARVSRR
jgi:hypothetical protein